VSETNPSVSAKEEANALKSTPLIYPQITQINEIIFGFFSIPFRPMKNQRKIIFKKSQKSAEICVICG
jgi:hypothetical protein